MKKTQFVFDGLLVLEFQKGSQKSLELLVKRHHKRLCNHAFGFTKNIEVSKDIVQDSWKVIILKLNVLKDPNSFSCWATKIVSRKCLDHLNRENRKHRILNDIKAEEQRPKFDGNVQESKLQEVAKAIKTLPENQQQILKLFYTQDYRLNEISEILDISVGTAKSRLFHAREKLKKILKNEDHEK